MVPIMSLWLPIVVSAVFVFVASSILHMVLPVHASDVRKLPKEDEVMESLRRFNLPPGDYVAPCPSSMSAMKDPAFIDKMNKGPVLVMTVRPAGPSNMGKSLALWFVYSIIVSIFAAYIAGRARPAGTDYLQIFRFAGCTAFVGYSLALLQNSIWWGKNWATTIKGMIDGLIYGLLTAGVFGWLWPR